MPRARIALSVLLALFVSSLASAQDGASRNDSIARLLDEGWGTGLAARQAVDEHSARLATSWPHDTQVEYAQALALVKQNRIAQALPVLATLTARDDAPLAAYRMLAWGQAATGDYAAALVSLEAYANRLVVAEDLPGHEMDDAIRFTGRLIGFMDGPSADAINAATVERHARAILAQYDDRQTRLFEEAVQDVFDTYAELTEGSTTSRERAAEEEDDRRQATRDQLAQQQLQVAERLAELDDQRAELLQTAEDALAEIDEELDPLEDDYADLESQAREPRLQMQASLREIQRLEFLLPDLPDGFERTRTIDRIHDLQWYYNRARDDLRVLSREGERIESQAARLNRRRLEIQAQYQQQLALLEEQVEELNDSVGRIQGQQRRVSGPGTGNTREARALAVRAGTLSTYDELPLDAYKADFLAELAADAP